MALSRFVVLSLALGVLAFAGRAVAQAEIGDSVTVTATVESIDLKTRTIDLKGADGKKASIIVPESVKNLEKLKVGDTLTTTYLVSFAAEILKPGETAPPSSVSASSSQGGGELVRGRQQTALLKVESVDLPTNSVTLTGPKGNTRTVKVKRPELQEKLKTLKPGDEVQLTYTEAIAITVEPKE
jgi:translation elongation factor P/translation initiation factor 5A